MSFPRYREYRESGVEWLGAVPSHWTVTALKHGYSVTLGKMLQPDAADTEDAFRPYLRAANIQWSGVDCSDIKSMWFSVRDRAQLLLGAGDLLVSEGGDVGRSALWKGEIEECYFQNSVNRVRPLDGNLNAFLLYWMSTMKDKGFIDVLCNKSTIAHFTAEKVGAVPVPLPTPQEQRSIATFLDRETAKIDALVEEQRRLIELLKEKRQAVISQAVTKGLDPSVPMKDSGVEWLGPVPAHWEVKTIKRCCMTTSGGTPDTAQQDAYYTDETGIPWVRTMDLDNDLLTSVEVYITERAVQDTACKVLPPGTVMVAMYGGDGTVGKNGLLGIPAAINQAICGLLPTEAVAPEYLFRYIQFFRPFWMVGAESSRKDPNISQERVRNAPVLLPPKEEQLAISQHLLLTSARFETLSTEAQRAVELLLERRSALISAAVTGKIDVRGLAAQ
jgi:type I restriction enzyme S subunit